MHELLPFANCSTLGTLVIHIASLVTSIDGFDTKHRIVYALRKRLGHGAWKFTSPPCAGPRVTPLSVHKPQTLTHSQIL
jgi:hypothetical protein